MTGALRGDHDHIDALGRHDAPEPDVEAVGEGQRLARRHVRRDVLVIDRLLLRVGSEDHHHIGGGRRFGDRQDLEPLLLRLGDRRRALAQPHDDVDTGVTQVEGVAVALRAIADHGDGLVADDRGVGVVGVIDVRGHFGSLQSSARVGSRRSKVKSRFGTPAPPGASAAASLTFTPAGPSPPGGAVGGRVWGGRRGRCVAAPPTRTSRAALRSRRACPGCPRG